jgi:hypothetical protein
LLFYGRKFDHETGGKTGNMVQKRFGTSARRKLLPLCGPFLASYELAHFLVKFLQNPPVEFQMYLLENLL